MSDTFTEEQYAAFARLADVAGPDAMVEAFEGTPNLDAMAERYRSGRVLFEMTHHTGSGRYSVTVRVGGIRKFETVERTSHDAAAFIDGARRMAEALGHATEDAPMVRD